MAGEDARPTEQISNRKQKTENRFGGEASDLADKSAILDFAEDHAAGRGLQHTGD